MEPFIFRLANWRNKRPVYLIEVNGLLFIVIRAKGLGSVQKNYKHLASTPSTLGSLIGQFNVDASYVDDASYMYVPS